MVNSIRNSGTFFTVLLFVLLVPLAGIRINNFHDWGDDFAQYLLQAEFLAGMIDHIAVSGITAYGPQWKGILFSVMLIPVFVLPVGVITGGKILISLFLIVSGILFYRIMLFRFNAGISMIMVLYLCYNYHVLRLKDQILPDFLFMGMLLSVVFLLQLNGQRYLRTAILICALSLAVKSAGIALIVAMGVYLVIPGNNPTDLRSRLKALLLLVILSSLVILAERIFNSTINAPAWYSLVVLKQFSIEGILHNFNTYLNAGNLIIEQELPQWLNTLLKFIIGSGVAGGIVLSIIRKQEIGNLIFCSYLLLLLIYPYHDDPIRFLIPVFPFVIIYVLSFYSWLAGLFVKRHQSILLLMLSLFLTTSQIISLKKEINMTYTYGPDSNEAKEMIQFVKEKTDSGDLIAFSKPWALAWYSRKNTTHSGNRSNADWLIIENGSLDNSDTLNVVNYKEIFKNNGYQIYDVGNNKTN